MSTAHRRGLGDGAGGGVAEAVIVALPPWVVARGVVAGSLALAHYLLDHLHPGAPGVAFRVHQGLLGWDAGFYQAIATKGYGGLGHQALRFFPLLPMLTKALATVSPFSVGTSLVIVSNACALAAGAMLYRLALTETGDERLARRACWLLAVVPPAFVLVMGYSEATMLVLTIGAFMALRARRFGWAALAGFLAGLARPVGLVLVVPAAIEALSAGSSAITRGPSRTEVVSRTAAVIAPVAGTGAFLAWVAWRFGDGLLPFRVQQQSTRRGGLTDPFHTLAHNASGILHGHVGSALHVPWAIGLVLLLLVCFRRWPISYAAFALVSLVVALTSSNLDSLERYALGAFPFVLTGASLTASRRIERGVFVLAGAGMAGYGLLAFMNAYVP